MEQDLVEARTLLEWPGYAIEVTDIANAVAALPYRGTRRQRPKAALADTRIHKDRRLVAAYATAEVHSGLRRGGVPPMPIINLRVPVLAMILAATAIPIALRPPQPPEWFPLSLDVYDVLANIAGFVPVGIVLAALGPLRAVTVAALLSLLAEAGQLVMLYRSPSLIDVATNVLGAVLGVIVAVRYDLKPEFTATRWIGTVAAALSALLILGTWMLLG